MKIQNKALVIISVLMLCIVFVSGFYPVKVSAAESKVSAEESFDYSVFKGTDFSKFTQEYCNSTLDSMVKPYDDYKDLEKSGLLETGKYFCSSYEDFKFGALPNNFLSRFLLSMERANRFNSSELLINKPIYYMFYEFTYTDSNNKKNLGYNWILSNSKFEFVSNSSDSSIINLKINGGVYDCNIKSLPFGSTIGWNNFGKSESFRYFAFNKSNLANFVYSNINGSNNGSYRNYYSENNYNFCGLYSNFEIPGIDLFDNIPDNVFSDGIIDPSFKARIDVKLTPEFGLDMDRVFDKNTGQNDYFKFEVTNNSNTNIQFCASIIDKKGNLGDTLDKALSGTIFEGALIFDYTEWKEGYWNYITDSQHYVDCYEESSKFLVLKKYRRYPELQKGNFYWVLLKPGDHFEDFIYWENVKINPNKEYSFVVDCIPTELEYSTDIFYSSEGETKVFSYPDEIRDIGNIDIDDYEKDSTLERYALNYKECKCVYNQVFSVTSIPDFTTNVRGGNSKITSGWRDTFVQSNNPYYRQDLSNGEIKPVENYSEFNGSLDSVNVDINNIKFEDIGKYVSYSQNFFKLLGSVFVIFPPWIWILICFGLTGLIVIGIIKAIL